MGGYTEAMSHAHGNYKVRELGLIQRGVSSIGCWPLCGTLSRCILSLVEHTCNAIICTPFNLNSSLGCNLTHYFNFNTTAPTH